MVEKRRKLEVNPGCQNFMALLRLVLLGNTGNILGAYKEAVTKGQLRND